MLSLTTMSPLEKLIDEEVGTTMVRRTLVVHLGNA
jgi:hypothetical protein